MTVLVVGGNGQLGAACCAELVARGVPVRATVRDPARATRLPSGVPVVQLDLGAGPDRRREALDGVDTLVLSANSAAARRGDRPEVVEEGLAALVDDAAAVGVRRVVLPSLPGTPVDDRVPLVRARRELERRLADAPLDVWVLRLPPFMEVWLALVGSSLPLRGEPHATVGRPSPFLRTFRSLTGSLVEDRGLMLVPGPATARHAFHRGARRGPGVRRGQPSAGRGARAAGGGRARGVELARRGRVFARVLGRPVRISSTPAGVSATASVLLRPFGDVPSRTMALNRYAAVHEKA